MIISKKEAKARGLLHSRFCLFHERSQDEAGAITCLDCRVIRDPCGCGENEACQKCFPESIAMSKRPAEQEEADAMYR